MPPLLKRTILACSLTAFFVVTAKAEIKIGIAVPLSGIYASLGEQIVAGAKFAAQEINQAGGIKGETITLDIIDDKCDEKAASGIANQFVGKGVIAVIGHLCDRPSIEASAVYSENRIVQISPTSQNPAFTENRPLSTGGTYRLAARNTQQADVLAAFMIKHSKSAKIAIVNDGSVYGKGLADAVSTDLQKAGITPVLTADFESGEERYRSLSARIVDSGATIVFIGGVHVDAATLIRDIDQLSDKITFVGGDGLVHSDFPTLVLADNPARQNLANIFASFPPDPRKLPSASAAVEHFKDAQINPAGLALRGYSALEILAQSLEKAGNKDFANLNQSLNRNAFDTPLGEIRFNAKGDANIIDYAIHRWERDTIIAVN